MNLFIYLFCSAFIQEFRNWESAWALEALYALAYEIRVLAERVWIWFCLIFWLNYYLYINVCLGEY